MIREILENYPYVNIKAFLLIKNNAFTEIFQGFDLFQ